MIFLPPLNLPHVRCKWGGFDELLLSQNFKHDCIKKKKKKTFKHDKQTNTY